MNSLNVQFKFEAYHSTLEIIGKLFGSANVNVSPMTKIDEQDSQWITNKI